MTVYEHMSWCQGAHDIYGECQIERPLVREGRVVLLGVPCDHLRIDVEIDMLGDGAEVDALVVALAELRPLLDASQGEDTCDAHNHDDDDEDEDEDEDELEYDDEEDAACDGCGTDVGNLLRVHIPADGSGQHLWWCRSCCQANGVEWNVP